MAKRHGLIEAENTAAAILNQGGYPWQNATASLKRECMIRCSGRRMGYPWQNATASLKHGWLLDALAEYDGYPWQNATASLKQADYESFRSVGHSVIRGKTPRPH